MNLFGIKFNLLIVIAAIMFGMVISSSLFCSCSRITIKEGLSLMGANIGYTMDQGVPGDIWKTPDASKKTAKNLYASLENTTAGSVPLPEGEMDLFYNNKFDAACCYNPQSYSSSTGCACMSVEQMKYLSQRAGNNTQ